MWSITRQVSIQSSLLGRGSKAVMQRPAKPSRRVRLPSSPPNSPSRIAFRGWFSLVSHRTKFAVHRRCRRLNRRLHLAAPRPGSIDFALLPHIMRASWPTSQGVRTASRYVSSISFCLNHCGQPLTRTRRLSSKAGNSKGFLLRDRTCGSARTGDAQARDLDSTAMHRRVSQA
jgi:hypothetical protein